VSQDEKKDANEQELTAEQLENVAGGLSSTDLQEAKQVELTYEVKLTNAFKKP
jgi:hypothetical protein